MYDLMLKILNGWDVHHVFFPEGKFARTGRLFRIFRSREQTIVIRVEEHQQFNTYIDERGCIDSEEGWEVCIGCLYADTSFCEVYTFRLSAAHCPGVERGNPDPMDFPCVRALCEMVLPKRPKGNCRDHSCGLWHYCPCSRCLNRACSEPWSCTGDPSSRMSCPYHVGNSVVAKEVPSD